MVNSLEDTLGKKWFVAGLGTAGDESLLKKKRNLKSVCLLRRKAPHSESCRRPPLILRPHKGAEAGRGDVPALLLNRFPREMEVKSCLAEAAPNTFDFHFFNFSPFISLFNRPLFPPSRTPVLKTFSCVFIKSDPQPGFLKVQLGSLALSKQHTFRPRQPSKRASSAQDSGQSPLMRLTCISSNCVASLCITVCLGFHLSFSLSLLSSLSLFEHFNAAWMISPVFFRHTFLLFQGCCFFIFFAGWSGWIIRFRWAHILEVSLFKFNFSQTQGLVQGEFTLSVLKRLGLDYTPTLRPSANTPEPHKQGSTFTFVYKVEIMLQYADAKLHKKTAVMLKHYQATPKENIFCYCQRSTSSPK